MSLLTLIKLVILFILVLVAVETYGKGDLTVSVEFKALNILADYANNANIEHHAEM